MQVLVTGAQGRVGSALVRTLLERGYAVRGFDLQPDNEKIQHAQYEYMQGDLLDSARAVEAVKGVDAVAHIAGLILFDDKQAKFIIDINWRATFELLEAMAWSGQSFKRFVYASSGQVYPENPDGLRLYNPVDEAHPQRPVNYYGWAKQASESMVWFYQRKWNIPGVCLRFTHVQYPYELIDPKSQWSGPRFFVNARLASLQSMASKPAVVEETIALLKGVAGEEEQLLLSCSPDGIPNEFNVSHPQDIADAVVLALEKDVAIGQAYNVGHGDPFNFGEVIPHMADKLNMPYVRLNIPISPYHGLTSNAKARAQLGYAPKYDPLSLIDAAFE